MSWRLARSLIQLRTEIDEAFPKRSRRSDGSIGDAAHASRASDHNPWIKDPAGMVSGVVSAIDITDDDASGADMRKLVHWLTTVSRDPRIKYLIHERKIYSSYPTSSTPAWAARPYGGVNAHMQHVHVSVSDKPSRFDDASRWGVAEAWRKATPDPGNAPVPAVRHAPRWPLPDGYYFGEESGPRESVSGYHGYGSRLRLWQEQMRKRGWTITADGRFGPQTRAVVEAFQREKRLTVTGHIWPATWAAAWEAPITK
jgi:peptidoglycan hydrolase-like protein with peptidoglycan-binding domain